MVELRVLDGPNLYFTRPAIKLTLDVSPWLALPQARAERLTQRTAFSPSASSGQPGSDQRRRYIAIDRIGVVRRKLLRLLV